MSDKDIIKDLFSEKLGNYEAKVNPELWNSIASQIGTAGAAGTAATGLSIAAKWIIGVGIAGALAVTAVLVTSGGDEPKNNPTTIEETPATELEDNSSESGYESNSVAENPTPAHVDPQGGMMVPNYGGYFTEPQDIEPIDIPTHVYTPILVPNVQGDRIIEQIFQRQDVAHTPDLVVKEPLLPAEIPAEKVEVTQAQQKDYSIEALPNVFTPNRDGANDEFKIKSENLTNFHIVVINSQNKVVFESHDPGFKWDGTDQFGQMVPAGNYVYYITADEFANDKPKRYSALLINY